MASNHRMTPFKAGASWPCALAKCGEPARYVCAWDAVSPKGRATTSEREYCEVHALRFAELNGVQVPGREACSSSPST